MKQNILIGLVFLAVVFLGYGLKIKQPVMQPGGVTVGNEYTAKTTFATTSPFWLYKGGAGSLGSIIVSVLGTGNITFYDATTTNVNKRTGQTATSSLNVLPYIGASQAAGTYVYDVGFDYGLLGVFSGSQGTTTVTYR